MSHAAFMYSDACAHLDYPPDCPFRVSRVRDTFVLLRNAGLLTGPDRRVVAPEPALHEQVLAIHDADYLKVLSQACQGLLDLDGLAAGLGTPETPVFEDLMTVALLAAGSAIGAARLLIEGAVDRTFSPLGGFHHAQRQHAEGFCYINDVALACETLAHSGRRVMCIDLDAHHGNGTQAYFYGRDDVMTVSLHQSGKTLYPWGGFEHETGEGAGLGYNANLSFPESTFDEIYTHAFHETVPALIEAFKPDVLVLEMGMDVLSGDPLTNMDLTNNAPIDILAWLCSLALPMLVTGGGGYHVGRTARAWARVWEVLCDEEDHHVVGMGGDMLGNSDWRGGWRDPVLPIPVTERPRIDAAVGTSIEALKRALFPLHGL